MSRQTIEKIIGASVVIALLGFAALFIHQGAEEHAAALVVCALGLVAFVLRSPFGGGPSSGEKPKRRGPPPLPMLWLLALGALALSGCISGIDIGRLALDRTATAADRIDRGMADARRSVSAEIRARPDATREEHRRAMRPFDEALEVTIDVDAAMTATERALDAAEAGEASDWMGLMACVLAAFADLTGIAARRIDIPDDAGDVLLVLGDLSRGACPLPEEDEPDVDAPAAAAVPGGAP